uniref:Uncharacterized protein n=1 Tax=Spongospora subterranea TaxID=70186 RepID=A0A0H5RJC1_9EUKA|eukprot:CRZ08779.1 hypothetical protein [Spongospora subterranea]
MRIDIQRAILRLAFAALWFAIIFASEASASRMTSQPNTLPLGTGIQLDTEQLTEIGISTDKRTDMILLKKLQKCWLYLFKALMTTRCRFGRDFMESDQSNNAKTVITLNMLITDFNGDQIPAFDASLLPSQFGLFMVDLFSNYNVELGMTISVCRPNRTTSKGTSSKKNPAPGNHLSKRLLPQGHGLVYEHCSKARGLHVLLSDKAREKDWKLKRRANAKKVSFSLLLQGNLANMKLPQPNKKWFAKGYYSQLDQFFSQYFLDAVIVVDQN